MKKALFLTLLLSTGQGLFSNSSQATQIPNCKGVDLAKLGKSLGELIVRTGFGQERKEFEKTIVGDEMKCCIEIKRFGDAILTDQAFNNDVDFEIQHIYRLLLLILPKEVPLPNSTSQAPTTISIPIQYSLNYLTFSQRPSYVTSVSYGQTGCSHGMLGKTESGLSRILHKTHDADRINDELPTAEKKCAKAVVIKEEEGRPLSPPERRVAGMAKEVAPVYGIYAAGNRERKPAQNNGPNAEPTAPKPADKPAETQKEMLARIAEGFPVPKSQGMPKTFPSTHNYARISVPGDTPKVVEEIHLSTGTVIYVLEGGDAYRVVFANGQRWQEIDDLVRALPKLESLKEQLRSKGLL